MCGKSIEAHWVLEAIPDEKQLSDEQNSSAVVQLLFKGSPGTASSRGGDAVQ